MGKEINIAEILKDKPQGTKLYSLTYGDCSYQGYTGDFGIECQSQNGVQFNLDEYGKYCIEGECILFPSKEMRDWSKFAWKKGDILVGCAKTIIFDGFTDDTYTLFKGKYCLQEDYYSDETTYIGEDEGLLTESFHIPEQCTAQAYIKVIEKRLCGKLNRETLEIDPVKSKHVFKPLEYVLSNDNEDKEWTLCQFSHFDKKGNAVFVGGSYADKGKVILHYEGNEHLLGTTKDVEE